MKQNDIEENVRKEGRKKKFLGEERRENQRNTN